jgi:hypothetical protein
MITTGKIIAYDGRQLTIVPAEPLTREILKKRIKQVELRLWDGRQISPEQRRKIYAIIRDIAAWSGHEPEELKALFKWNFCSIDGREEFSLSDVDMTTAREFITYLIEFCFYNNVPTMDSLLNRTDDIGKYLYLCLEHRKCAICNDKAHVHHVNRIGMGRDREKICHVGLEAIALCTRHHDEAHRDEKKLFADYHIYGIKLDEYLCEKLNLNTKPQRGILQIPQ